MRKAFAAFLKHIENLKEKQGMCALLDSRFHTEHEYTLDASSKLSNVIYIYILNYKYGIWMEIHGQRAYEPHDSMCWTCQQ